MTTQSHPDAQAPRCGPGTTDPTSVRSDREPLLLVVDDSSDMRTLLSEALEPAGYEVVTASSSGQALTFMSERVPDLVITDLMMPGMSGFSLRSHMLRRPRLATVPVVVLSAYWARPGETLDAIAVLRKPVNLDRLLDTVQLALSVRPAS